MAQKRGELGKLCIENVGASKKKQNIYFFHLQSAVHQQKAVHHIIYLLGL